MGEETPDVLQRGDCAAVCGRLTSLTSLREWKIEGI